MNKVYNENIYVEIPEEKGIIKTQNNNAWREAIVIKSSDERFKEGMKVIIQHSSAIKYKEGYFVQTRHILADV